MFLHCAKKTLFTMPATSKNVLFPGCNHLLTHRHWWPNTLIIARVPVAMVVSWWIVFFWCSALVQNTSFNITQREQKLNQLHASSYSDVITCKVHLCVKIQIHVFPKIKERIYQTLCFLCKRCRGNRHPNAQICEQQYKWQYVVQPTRLHFFFAAKIAQVV